MVSLRDPLRDNLLFADFAQGVVIGCVLLAALSALDYQRLMASSASCRCSSASPSPRC